MGEISQDINKKTSILLSRNSPVALVVGAAGFLGSHLVDELLEKRIQVVAVDDLENGEKQNLRAASQNRDFHLIIGSPEKIDFDLPRLDYLFILPDSRWNLEKILELFKQFKCRSLFVSSIDLYENSTTSGELKWLRTAEVKIARFASEHGLNARILRLGPVYGPRMDFKPKDPLIKLIRLALAGDLQKDVSLEFSSRALFVLDAVDLMVKTIFAGSTAQKIFDGVLPAPVKVAEVKQVLLDPVWYETKDFAFSELPPWPSPNLDKTVKFLNWRPKRSPVAGLRQTLSYFKDNEIEIAGLEVGDEKLEAGKRTEGWDEEKKTQLEAFKQEQKTKPKQTQKAKKGIKLPGFSRFLPKIYLFTVISLVTYALIWPGLVLGWGIFTFRSQFNSGLENLNRGELEKSLNNIKQAEAGIAAVKSFYNSLEPVRKLGLFNKEFASADNMMDFSGYSLNSSRSVILGMEALFQGIKAVTGELAEDSSAYFSLAQIELSSGNEDLSKADALLASEDFRKNLPRILVQEITGITDKLALYSALAKQAQAISILLPGLVGLDGSESKNYLVLLQDNTELRPAGGVISSFAKVSFEKGKLKKLDVNDTDAIDKQLGIHVEPPKEIKEDLGQKDWFLRDSNWEADFPTAARQAEWFYTKETGERADGVATVDISAIEGLLSATGSLDLAGYNEKIISANLFEKAVSYAEKKSFLTALTDQLFNKIFFLPGQNWPGIISALGKSLTSKHISIYLNNPKLFSYLDSQGWTHALPRASVPPQDFLSLVEANLGANKVNYYLDRNYKLETVAAKEGEISHRLRVSYTNRSPADVFPGGAYKNRMRIYLPFGSKLTRALWGESDITKDVSGFVDYGRSGYSMLLKLASREQKTLVLDYSVPVKLEFQDGKAVYRLDIIKQPGTLKDPLEWTISYPVNYQIVSDQTQKISPLREASPQEYTISTDLSTDRSFKVEFKK